MKEEIELRHLRYFLAVAETLHFTKAAAQLRMAQPPLSQQIRSLERILGHPLFQRTTRGVQLTKVGEYFRERAQNTVTRMQDDVEMARRLGSGQEGVLTVGFSGSVMLTTLPKAIERYRRVYPKVELRLRELVTAEQIPPLRDGTLDLGFLRDAEPREGLSIETILRERFIAVLPVRHRLARRITIRPRDLRNEPFVLFARRMGPLAFDRTLACCEAEGFRPNVVQEAPQWPTVVRLVAAGSGISLAPACVANFAMPGVVYKKVRSRHWTTIDIGLKPNLDNPAVEALLTGNTQEPSGRSLSRRSPRHPPGRTPVSLLNSPRLTSAAAICVNFYSANILSWNRCTGGIMRDVIATPEAPQAIGPYSQAIRAAGLIFTSGQVAIDPATQQVVAGDVSAQTERVLTNLSVILQASGSTLEKVLRCTVFLKNMGDFAAMNEVYGRYFKHAPPARSTVEVARLPKDVLVEIDVIALA